MHPRRSRRHTHTTNASEAEGDDGPLSGALEATMYPGDEESDEDDEYNEDRRVTPDDELSYAQSHETPYWGNNYSFMDGQGKS